MLSWPSSLPAPLCLTTTYSIRSSQAGHWSNHFHARARVVLMPLIGCSVFSSCNDPDVCPAEIVTPLNKVLPLLPELLIIKRTWSYVSIIRIYGVHDCSDKRRHLVGGKKSHIKGQVPIKKLQLKWDGPISANIKTHRWITISKRLYRQ